MEEDKKVNKKDKLENQKEDKKDSSVKLESKKETRKPRKLKLDNDLVAIVKNTSAGRLIYVDDKDGTTFIWQKPQEVQEVEIKYLKNMKASQVGFFKNNHIQIADVYDIDYEDIGEIYRALGIADYYKDLGYNFDVYSVLTDKNDKTFRNKVKALANTNKTLLITTTKSLIESEKLTDLKKIKFIEATADCKFDF